MKIKRLVVPGVVVALLAGAAVVLIWFNPFADEEPAPRTATVTRGELVESAALSGKVEPDTQVEVKSRASGEVIKVAVEVGDKVKAGDLLVKLDPADETRNLEQAEAALSSSKARLERAQAALAIAELQAAEAEAKYQARKANPDSDIVTKEEIRIAKSNWEIAQGNVASLKADVQSAESDVKTSELTVEQANLRLSETTIHAPIDGTVLSLEVEKGTIIASGISNIGGGTPLLTLGDLSSLLVVGALDEADVGRVDEGQEVQIRVDAYPDRVFKGQVERLSPLGIETSNIVTFDLDVRVSDEEFYLLKPGMSADLEVITSRNRGVLLVPIAAIYSEGRQYFVRTLGGERKDVKLGPTNGTHYVVNEGVAEGDELLISESTSNLNPGPGMFGGRR